MAGALTRSGARALVARQAAAWMSADPDAVAADFAPDGLLITPGGRWAGRVAVRAAAADFFARGARVDVRIGRLLADGDGGAVEWTWTETAPDGSREATDDGIIFAVGSAGLTYWREYFG